MAHIGFTPQSEHVLGGYRVQGRGDGGRQAARRRPGARGGRRVRRRHGDGARRRGGRRSPRRCASRPSASAPARTATPRCWSGRTWPGCAAARAPRFVKKYADLRADLKDAAERVRRRGRLGRVPGRRALVRGLKPPRPKETSNHHVAHGHPRTHRRRPAGRPCRAAPRRRARTAGASSTSRPPARTCTARRASSPGWCPRPRGCSTPGCGFGRVASKLTRLGHTAIGVDADEHLIALAREDTADPVLRRRPVHPRPAHRAGVRLHRDGGQRGALPRRRHPPPGARPARRAPGPRRLPRLRLRPGRRPARQGGGRWTCASTTGSPRRRACRSSRGTPRGTSSGSCRVAPYAVSVHRNLGG